MEALTRWQNINFSLMFVSYGMLFLCRKSFSYLLPAIIAEESFSRGQLGIISSSLSLAYCLSKFICGVISDRVQPHLFLTLGLIEVGICTALFANSHSLALFSIFWFLNGLGQGCGWPPCTKLLKQWYHPSELGTYWSLLSSSSNLAGVVGPLVLTLSAQQLGWRFVMMVAGCICLLSSTLTYTFVKDSPSDVGLPPIDKRHDGHDGGQWKSNGSKESLGNGVTEKRREANGIARLHGGKEHDSRTDANGVIETQPSDSEHSNINDDRESTMGDVVRSPFLWVISFIFFCCMLQAAAFQEWAQLLLIQERGFSSAVGSGFTSAYNVGGTIGCIASGYITDRLVARSSSQKVGSPRLQYLKLVAVCSICCQLYLLRFTTPETSQLFLMCCAFFIGFCIYGSVSLNGVLVVEHSPVYLSGSAHAIGALAGNVGSVAAGFPLSLVSSIYSWSATFLIVLSFNVINFCLLLVASKIDLTIGRHSKTKSD